MFTYKPRGWRNIADGDVLGSQVRRICTFNTKPAVLNIIHSMTAVHNIQSQLEYEWLALWVATLENADRQLLPLAERTWPEIISTKRNKIENTANIYTLESRGASC